MGLEFKPYPFSPRRYAPVLPPLAGGVEARRHPVLIVGGGPVGLTLALGLADHGVASVILEADDAVCEGSRAICLSRRSLQIFDRLGALAPFMAKGLPWTGGAATTATVRCCDSRCPTTRTRNCLPCSIWSSSISSSICSTRPNAGAT